MSDFSTANADNPYDPKARDMRALIRSERPPCVPCRRRLSRADRSLVARETGTRRAVIDGFERPATGALVEVQGYSYKQPAEPAHPYHPLSHPSGTVEPFDVVEARVLADLKTDMRKNQYEYREREREFQERFGAAGRARFKG